MANIISQKKVFEAKYFKLMENTIDFGSGITRVHHDVYRSDAVSVFPLTDLYELYMIKQYRYLHKKFILESIAGMVEEGELPIKTAKKELKEEAGIVAKDLRIFRSLEIGASMYKATQHFILAKDLTITEAEPEETEEISLVKLPLHKAVEKVLSGEISTAGSIIGILLIDKMKQRGEL